MSDQSVNQSQVQDQVKAKVKAKINTEEVVCNNHVNQSVECRVVVEELQPGEEGLRRLGTTAEIVVTSPMEHSEQEGEGGKRRRQGRQALVVPKCNPMWGSVFRVPHACVKSTKIRCSRRPGLLGFSFYSQSSGED